MNREQNRTAIAEGLAHPLRIEILRRMQIADTSLSPKLMSVSIGEKLPTVSYHVRQLVERQLVTLVDMEPQRGAIEHFIHSRQAMPARHPRGTRQINNCGAIRRLIDRPPRKLQLRLVPRPGVEVGQPFVHEGNPMVQITFPRMLIATQRSRRQAVMNLTPLAIVVLIDHPAHRRRM